jgi:hypothetical protein
MAGEPVRLDETRGWIRVVEGPGYDEHADVALESTRSRHGRASVRAGASGAGGAPRDSPSLSMDS